MNPVGSGLDRDVGGDLKPLLDLIIRRSSRNSLSPYGYVAPGYNIADMAGAEQG